MTQPYIVGAAMAPMGRFPESSHAALAAPPLLEALASAGLDRTEIQAVACGSAYGGLLVGQRILKEVGLGGIPVTNVDNACSSGATALREAYWDVREGRHEIVAAIGIDKLSQFGGGTVPLSQEDWEVRQGLVMPALYAMRARRYLEERDAAIEDLAAVSVKARRHGSANPYAQLRKEVTVEEVLGSRMIADPLTLFQCCPTGDGAAVALVVSERVRRRLAGPAIKIRASVLHSGKPTSGYRDMLVPQISYDSAADAYEMAGVGPDDLDLVELHDAFTIAELVYYEALGLCAPGNSLGLLRDGATTYGGPVVVNPSGGLLAKGHPVGASGVAQTVEIFWHLTGQAGARQVPGARMALSHVTGGGISKLDHGACAIHIYEGESS